MHSRLPSCAFLIAVFGIATFSAHAQDPNAARGLAATCFTCHGTDGISGGGIPSIVGLNKEYMLRQLRDFKSGKRSATIMHQQARGYTDQQLEQIANYFAAAKSSAAAPASRSGF